jgi:hypothetical protein
MQLAASALQVGYGLRKLHHYRIPAPLDNSTLTSYN